MKWQLRLFYEQPHYEQDCFLSGDSRYPDPLEEAIRYDTWQVIEEEVAALNHFRRYGSIVNTVVALPIKEQTRETRAA